MAELRRAALDVLAGLRSIEESLRTPLNVHSEEEVDRQLSPIGETSETSSSALDVSSTGPNSIRPQSAASGTYSQLETYLDDEEEYSFNSMAQTGEIEHVQTWEERLVSEGREFRSLEEQEDKERSVRESVRKWILTAERVFLVGALEEDVRVEEWAMDSWEGKVLGASYVPSRLNQLMRSSMQSACTPFFSRTSRSTYNSFSLHRLPTTSQISFHASRALILYVPRIL
jgi:hypothetical protein